jgi:hypothetical protein
LAGFFEGVDGIFEGGGGGLSSDLIDFCQLLLHGFEECRAEVFFANLVELRRLEWEAAGVIERIIGRRGWGRWGSSGHWVTALGRREQADCGRRQNECGGGQTKSF